MNLLAKIVLKLHKKFPQKIPVMSCYGCLKEDCLNRSYSKNKICDGYTKGFLFFGDRKKLEDAYREWLSTGENIADTAFNVITFLEINDLLDYKKVKKYIRGEK